MLSESARMSTAREAAFRIDYPNSKPRAIKVIALDDVAAEVVRDTARQQDWKNATFFTGMTASWDPKRPWGTPIHASLTDLDGKSRDLAEEIGSANLVVMVSSPAGNADAAALIAEICSMKRVMITGLLLKADTANDADIAHSLKELRPHAPMLVISTGDDYVSAMLTALRA
ncbi:MAG TPA: hypothetical protein VN240_12045 [Propylenella sp.]|nr:hypothetical protein [Propylenella sp.]